MHVLLISTPTRTRLPNQFPPLGMMYLAAFLEKHGHKATIIDNAKERPPAIRTIERIKACQPDLIGISGIITAYSYIIKLSHALKGALPEIPIVLGGQVVVNNLQNCFRYMACDYTITGYGEIPLIKLLRHLAGELPKESIPGLSYREQGDIISVPGREYVRDLDEIPLPAYHLVDMEYYTNTFSIGDLNQYLEKKGISLQNNRGMFMMAALGCTSRCSFCIHEQEYVGMKKFSMEYLKNHIQFLYDNYNIRILHIGEEMFVTTLKRLIAFNDMMLKFFPDMIWRASTRASHITKEIVEELERGNCYLIAWGFETGSQSMLNYLNKRVTLEENLNAFIITSRSHVHGICCFMIGNIGETDNTIRETIRSLRHAKIGPNGVFYAQAYPGGRTWDWAVERRVISDTHDYLLRASDKDASTGIEANLTPYPNWILKLWYLQVKSVMRQNTILNNRIEFTERKGIRSHLRKLLGDVAVFVKYPWTRLTTHVYCGLHDLRVKYFPNERDQRYEFMLDKNGAVLPKKLRVGRPQRHLSKETLKETLSHDLIRSPIMGSYVPFVDGVHIKSIPKDDGGRLK